jgi:hypothetical protein
VTKPYTLSPKSRESDAIFDKKFVSFTVVASISPQFSAVTACAPINPNNRQYVTVQSLTVACHLKTDSFKQKDLRQSTNLSLSMMRLALELFPLQTTRNLV